MRLTKLAHDTVKQVIVPGDIAIDATVGNGFDLLFLAQQVTQTGHVYGFDIQATALDIARQKLNSSQPPQSIDRATQEDRTMETPSAHVTLLCACHSTMLARISQKHHGNIGAVMFNLGYLPHGDHRIVTHPATTISAIRQSIALLRPQGIITILAYPGHEGGKAEVDAIVEAMANSQDQLINWTEGGIKNTTLISPRLFVGRKPKVNRSGLAATHA